jgi:translocation and assembly module TamB
MADFTFSVDSLDISDFTDLMGVTPLSGRVSAEGSLTGTRSHPTLDCSVRSQLKPGRKRAARIAARLRWADQFDLEASFRQKGEEGLGVSARLPWPLSLSRGRSERRTPPADASMSARLDATHFDLAWFEPLIPPHRARRFDGKLDGAVEAKGDPSRPSLSGSLALSGGGVELPGLGARYRDAEAAVELSGQTVRLDRAHLESAGGTIKATGTLTFLGGGRRSLDLRANLERFVAMNTKLAKAAVSGEVRLTGDPMAAVARGGLQLVHSTIYLEGGTEQAEAVTLTASDRLELQEKFGIGVADRGATNQALIDSVDADFTLKIGDNVWIRRNTDPVVSLELQGEIRARKARGGTLDLRGDVRARTGRSYLSFVGRRFDITRVVTTLNGPIDSASVEMEARYLPESSGGARVTALVNVDVDGVTTDLRSEPHMDRAALLKYLATGQTEGEVQSGTAYGLATGAALGAVGGVAGRSLGLDVVQVTMDAYGGQVLSAGSYVDPRVYLGFRQPVVQGENSRTGFTSGSNPTEFEIEFEARRSLLFNVQGNSSRYRFLLRPRLGR